MASTSSLRKYSIACELICVLLNLVLVAFGCYIYWYYRTNEIATLAAYGYIIFGFLSRQFCIRENACCMVLNVIFMVVEMIGKMGILYLLVTHEHSVASNLANSLDVAWEEELKSPGAMSIYENWFGCCGRGSPQDYIVNERLPPATCYRDGDSSQIENLFENGCRVEYEEYWLHLLHSFNIYAMVVIGVEFVTSFVACSLFNSMRNDRRRSYF